MSNHNSWTPWPKWELNFYIVFVDLYYVVSEGVYLQVKLGSLASIK